MTREETVQILSLLKAAYPASYKGMTRDEANGVISVWATQFARTPADVILIAVNKLIAKNRFPPSVSEVKEKLNDMYDEAVWELSLDRTYGQLTTEQTARLVRIADACKCDAEPTLLSLAGAEPENLLTGG